MQQVDENPKCVGEDSSEKSISRDGDECKVEAQHQVVEDSRPSLVKRTQSLKLRSDGLSVRRADALGLKEVQTAIEQLRRRSDIIATGDIEREELVATKEEPKKASCDPEPIRKDSNGDYNIMFTNSTDGQQFQPMVVLQVTNAKDASPTEANDNASDEIDAEAQLNSAQPMGTSDGVEENSIRPPEVERVEAAKPDDDHQQRTNMKEGGGEENGKVDEPIPMIDEGSPFGVVEGEQSNEGDSGIEKGSKANDEASPNSGKAARLRQRVRQNCRLL